MISLSVLINSIMSGMADFPGMLVGVRKKGQQGEEHYLAVRTNYLPTESDINELVRHPGRGPTTLEELAKHIIKTVDFKSCAETGNPFSIITLPYRLAQFTDRFTVEVRPLTENEMLDLTRHCGEAAKKIKLRKPHDFGVGAG